MIVFSVITIVKHSDRHHYPFDYIQASVSPSVLFSSTHVAPACSLHIYFSIADLLLTSLLADPLSAGPDSFPRLVAADTAGIEHC